MKTFEYSNTHDVLGEYGEMLQFRPSNLGEPYRETIEVSLLSPDVRSVFSCHMTRREVVDLHRWLGCVLANDNDHDPAKLKVIK